MQFKERTQNNVTDKNGEKDTGKRFWAELTGQTNVEPI